MLPEKRMTAVRPSQYCTVACLQERSVCVDMRAYSSHRPFVYIASDAASEPSQQKDHGAYACRNGPGISALQRDKNVLPFGPECLGAASE